MSKPNLEEYGWVAVPRNRQNVPSAPTTRTSNESIDFDKIWPDTKIVQLAKEHVASELPSVVLSHSLRVYCYGHTMVKLHFPDWASKDEFMETWALTCLFHDIGTAPQNVKATHMSFEFQGGFLALQWLLDNGAPREQAESVCEAIIRHQDPGETGTISRMGQLVQLATEFGEKLAPAMVNTADKEIDNMGYNSQLLTTADIEAVTGQFPRRQWSSCFSGTIEKEIAEKPWCHTTALDGFAEAVRDNKLMQPYE